MLAKHCAAAAMRLGEYARNLSISISTSSVKYCKIENEQFSPLQNTNLLQIIKGFAPGARASTWQGKAGYKLLWLPCTANIHIMCGWNLSTQREKQILLFASYYAHTRVLETSPVQEELLVLTKIWNFTVC